MKYDPVYNAEDFQKKQEEFGNPDVFRLRSWTENADISLTVNRFFSG